MTPWVGFVGAYFLHENSYAYFIIKICEALTFKNRFYGAYF
jgi:hypothetical protein